MPLFNVKDYGAAGNGVANDSTAIQAAINACSSNALGGIVYFPSGIYLTSPIAQYCVFDLRNKNNILFLGDGSDNSEIRLMAGAYTGDLYQFRLDNSHNLTWRGLRLNGNRYQLGTADEQTHGINCYRSTDITVEYCKFKNIYGDGFRVYGSPNSYTDNIRLFMNDFDSCQRSGIGCQRAFRNALFLNCKFYGDQSDQAIDFEPSGNGAPEEITIANCIIDTAVPGYCFSLYGISNDQPLKNIKVFNNTIKGEVIINNVDGLQFYDNTVSGYNKRTSIYVLRKSTNVDFYKNTIVSPLDKGIWVSYNNGYCPDSIYIRENIVKSFSTGVYVETSNNVSCSNNNLFSLSPSASTAIKYKTSYKQDSLPIEMNNPSIIGNNITGYVKAVELIASNGNIINCEVRDNRTNSAICYTNTSNSGYTITKKVVSPPVIWNP